LERVLGGAADASIDFDDLCHLLRRLGFEERIRGSHHIYRHRRLQSRLNLQPQRNGKAKEYQVVQVRLALDLLLSGGNGEEI
jgi:predicted RNA binding protein YcfA (HicA-like mRNA interferase family)